MTQHTQPGGKVKEREWVLGDADVATLWREFLVTATLWPHNASNTPWDFARSVEAAVLAKVRAERDFLPRTEREAQAAYLNAKWEREARKRERAAWDAACAFWSQRFSPRSEEERNRRYPLPTKRVPREVRLSDGRAYSGAGSLDSFRGPLTPDDMRKLLGLVERPYDEVPDDA